MTTKIKRQFFAPCPRGLEAVLAAELAQIGADGIMQTDGGVGFAGTMALAYRANLHSRIASRILWKLVEKPYRSEDDIYRAALDLSWPSWFEVDHTIRVDVTAIKSPLKSLEFIVLKIKDAICDKFRAACGERPSVQTVGPDIRIYGFLTADRVTLYLDTSGEALFKRGYRKESGIAPLRENLAAGILKLAGWESGMPLLDPMCGSGTFLIEAAMMALNIAPGIERWFAFEKFKTYDAVAWEAIYNEAAAAEMSKTPLPIYGSDKYGYVLDATRANLAQAGLEEVVQIKQVDVLNVSAPAPGGILVTNPPYGERLGDEQELAEFYPQLGNVLKKHFGGWSAYIITADPALAKLIRLTASRRTPLYNGALECRLFEFKMVAGSNREKYPAAGVSAAGFRATIGEIIHKERIMLTVIPKLTPAFVEELNFLAHYDLDTMQEGIKVHKDAAPDVIASAQRLYDKKLVTLPDGGYLTALGREVAEQLQSMLTILKGE